MTLIPCPLCGSTSHWAACEQQTWITPCDLVSTETGIEIEITPVAEMRRDMASAITIAYVCTAPECGYGVPAERLNDELKEASVEEEKPVQQPGESWDDFSERKGHYDAAKVEERKNEADAKLEKESPLVKFGRVFGGEDT